MCDIKKEHGKVKVYSYKSQIKVSTDGKDVSVKVRAQNTPPMQSEMQNHSSPFQLV